MGKKLLIKVEVGQRNGLDNDYNFYDDGTIENYYDKSTFKLNITEEIKLSDIDLDLKSKLLEKCKPQDLEKLQEILKDI